MSHLYLHIMPSEDRNRVIVMAYGDNIIPPGHSILIKFRNRQTNFSVISALMQMPQGLNAHLPVDLLFCIFAKKF
jgi:hypothetical protein